MKVVTIVGARPQFVKAAAVSRAIRRAARSTIREVIVHTGQHYDKALSASFFQDLQLARPAHNLEAGSGSATAQVSRMMARMERVVIQEAPDIVMTYGDTNSTLAGALVAAQVGLPSAHVEAGLRSHRLDMPEEINRLVADRLATLLFAPSEIAVENLEREGIREGVVRTGDVMRDVLDWRLGKLGDTRLVPAQFSVSEREYAVATVHRAGNTDDPDRLGAIFRALDRLSTHVPVIVPLHPRTRHALHHGRWSGDLRILDPLPYGQMIGLVRHARIVLTDSGGLQKEACWLGVPCVTLRSETEWLETVETGWNVLADVDPEAIVEAALREPPTTPCDLYGDGHAAERVVSVLTAWSGP